MADVNVRIREALVEALQQRAARRRLSVSALVNEFVEAALLGAPTFDTTAVATPVGLCAHAEPLVNAAGSQTRWVLVFRGADGAEWIAVGTVSAATPTTLSFHVEGERVHGIPRTHLTCWEHVEPRQAPHLALSAAVHRFSAWGARVHPAQRGWAGV